MFLQIVPSLNQGMYALVQRGYNGSELFYTFPQKNPRKKANIAKMLVTVQSSALARSFSA
jgi:hypothetical protein